MTPGTLHILSVGPGAPDLMTVRAAEILRRTPWIAHFAKRGAHGHARGIAGPWLRADVREMRFDYPYTEELDPRHATYREAMAELYDGAADRIAGVLEGGESVALLCEGDAFLYGSAMYVFDRLRDRHAVAVVPGVTGMSACWSAAGLPLVHGDDALTVVPATLGDDALAARLAGGGAFVVMKIGRHAGRVRAALEAAGLADRAVYVERGGMEGERVLPLAAMPERAPYFSIAIVPGRRDFR